MALVALEGGNTAKAVELADKALAHGARSAMVIGGCGRALLAAGRQDEARALVGPLVPGDCKDPVEADTIGVILARTGLHRAALPFFARAVEAEPANPQFLYNLATSRQFAGELAAAKADYARLLELAPGFHRARLALVQLQSPEEHDLAAIERHFRAAGADPDAALQLGHAAARVHEANGDHAAALDWLFRAKQGKAAQVRHDQASAQRLFAAAAASQLPVTPEAAPQPRPAPVFVIGMPRSGTTLVERILSSHPDVASAGELPDFALLLKRSTGVAGPHTLSPEVLTARFDPAEVGIGYRARIAPLAEAAARVVDKMPFNLFFARHILASLPEARIVMVRRDPRDTVFANFRQLFATDFGYYDYAYDLADTARFVAHFSRLADHWRATLPPERYTEVAYETLVAAQEAESRRLIDFLGLAWDPACLAFHRNAAPVATASSVQVRAPIHARSVGQWRRYGRHGEEVDNLLREEGLALPN